MAIYPWDTRRDITSRELVDELRMPRIYGETWGDPRGMVDPAALTAFSQGGGYDIQARRNAIAKRLLENQLAQQAAQVTPPADAALPGEGIDQYRFSGEEPDVGVGAGDTPAATGREPGNVTQQGFFENATPDRSFTQGQPPGPSMFGPDRGRGETAPGGRSTDAIVGSIMDNVAAANAIAQAMSQAAPTPSGAPPGGYPGEHSDVPGATPSTSTTAPAAPTGGATVHSGSIVAPGAFGQPGSGEQGSTAGKGASMPGGGVILGEGGRGWSGAAVTPSGGFPSAPDTTPGGRGQPGSGEKGYNASPNAIGIPGNSPIMGTPDQTTSTHATGRGRSATDAITQALADIALASPTPAASSSQFAAPSFGSALTAPAGLPSSTGSFNSAAMQASAPGSPGMPGGYGGIVSPSMSGRDFGNVGYTSLADMANAMSAVGMPSPGGGQFGSGFGFGNTAVADPSLSDTGDITGTGSQATGAQGAVGFGGLSGEGGGPSGLGGGGVGGAGPGGGGLGATGAAGAAGGEGGFGGMGPGGGVGPGGMSTGGTGEVGSVSGGGPSGTGGIGGAGMGGGVGSPGSGGFDSGSGDTTGSGGDTTGSGDTAGGSAP